MSGTIVRRSPGRKGTPQAEPPSKLPQTVAEVLDRHVTLQVESIDRMYLHVIVGRLQILEGALRFLRGQRASALRFADPMVQSLWNALLLFDLLPAGFSNRDLRRKLADLRGQPVAQFTQGRMTYQLRRLRLHGLIERIPKTHRYQLTKFGFRVAAFCTRTYSRILRPGLGLVLPATSSFQLRCAAVSINSNRRSNLGCNRPDWLRKT